MKRLSTNLVIAKDLDAFKKRSVHLLRARNAACPIALSINVNVNVNVEVYSLKSPWVQQTLQFTPLVLELSLLRSHLLWGEFSAFSAADAIHNFSNFRSTRYPSLLGGQRQYGMRGFAQHLYTSINFSDLWELVNLPCATIGVGDCEANQSSWHVALWFMYVHLEAPLLMHYCAAFIGCLFSRLWRCIVSTWKTPLGDKKWVC